MGIWWDNAVNAIKNPKPNKPTTNTPPTRPWVDKTVTTVKDWLTQSDPYNGKWWNDIVKHVQKQREEARTETQQSFLNKYNDPNQINSILDALGNENALRKKYGKIDLGTRLKAIKDYHYDSIIKPILAGQGSIAFINMLQGVGETVDVFDNIIKSQTTVWLDRMTGNEVNQMDFNKAQEVVNKMRSGDYQTYLNHYSHGFYLAKGENMNRVMTQDGWVEFNDAEYKVIEEIVNSGRTVNPHNLTWDERLKSAIGTGDYGRINYDYNTGNNGVNFMLEVVTGLWDSALSAGVDALAKPVIKQTTDALATAAKAGLKELTETGIKNIADVEKLGITKRAFDLYKAGKVVVEDSAEKELLSAITGVAVNTKGIQQEFALGTLSDAMTLTLARIGFINPDVTSVKYVKDLLDRSVRQHVNGMTTTIIRATDQMVNAKNNITKALLYTQLPPAGAYSAVKFLKNSPGLAKWVANNLDVVGKANSVDGAVGIEALTDNYAAMKAAQNEARDALARDVTTPPEFLRMYDSVIRDNNYISKIIASTQESNAAKQLHRLQNYLQQMHHNQSIEDLIQDATQYYYMHPDYNTKYYLELLQRTKDYLDITADYVAKQEARKPYLAVQWITRKTIDNRDFLTDVKNKLLNDLHEVADVPFPYKLGRAKQAAYNTMQLFETGRFTTALRRAGIESTDLTYKKLFNTITQYSNNMVTRDTIDPASVDRFIEQIAQIFRDAADEANAALKLLPDPDLKGLPTLPVLERVQKGVLPQYDIAKEVLSVFRDAGCVKTLEAIMPEKEAKEFAKAVAAGQYDAACIKLENSLTTDYLLSCDNFKAISEAFDPSGELGKLLTQLSYLPLDELAGPARDALKAVLDPFAAQRHYMNLLTKLQNIPNFSSKKFEALKQAMQNFVNTSKYSAYTNTAGFTKRLVYNANNFLGAQQQTTKYTVDAYLKENLDTVNKFRAKLGYDPITAEEHTALSDSITQYVMWREFTANNPQYANKKFAIIDLEAKNTSVHADSNTIWQAGIFSDTLTSEHTLASAQFNKYLHAPDEAFMRAQLNEPDTEYTYLLKHWQEKYLAQGTELSEEDIITDFLNNIYDQAQGTWTGKNYDFVLVAHNGYAFDYELLHSKIANYLANGGLAKAKDPHILDKIELADTLELWHKADGWEVIEASEVPAITSAMFEYMGTMKSDYSSLFSAVSDTQLYSMDSALQMLHSAKLISDETLEQATTLISTMRQTLQSVADMNADLSRYAINLNKLTSDAQAFKKVMDYFASLGVDADELAKRMEYAARTGDFNLSTLLYSVPQLQNVGWKTLYRAKEMNGIFDNKLLMNATPAELDAMYQFARRTVRRAPNIPIEFLNDQVVTDMWQAIRKVKLFLTQNYEQLNEYEKNAYHLLQSFNFLQNINLELHNSQQIASIFQQVLTSAYSHDPDLINAMFIRSFKSKDDLIALLTPQHYELDYVDRWTSEMFNGRYSSAVAYTGVMYDFMTNQHNLHHVSQEFEAAGIAGAAVQARTAAITPGLHLATTMKRACDLVAQLDARYPQYGIKDQLNNILARTRLDAGQRVTEAAFRDPNKLIPWLGASGGLIIFEDPEIFKQLNTAALAKQNILTADLGGNQFVVALTKDAKYTQYFDADGKVVYNINGMEYYRPDFELDSFTDTAARVKHLDLTPEEVFVTQIAKHPEDVDKAYELQGLLDNLATELDEVSRTVAFISDGAAVGTTFEHMDLDGLTAIRSKLPKAIQDQMADLPSGIIFQNNGWNHTVLGSAELVKAFTGKGSDDPIKMLCKANLDVAQAGNTVATYASAMLSEDTKLRNTVMDRLIHEDPTSAIRWMQSHPEYTLVRLDIADTKYGYKVSKYEATDVLQAVEAGAHIVPTNVYDKLYKVINTSEISNSALKAYNAVERLYKIGYLMFPSTAMNNTLDAFIKTVIETKAGPGTVAHEYANAVKIFMDFDRITQQIMEIIPPDTTFGIYLKTGAMEEFFKANNFSLDYDTYMYYYRLLQESAAGGEISTLSKYSDGLRIDYLKDLQAEGKVTPDVVRQAQASARRDVVFSRALNGMNFTESVARIAQFNVCSKQGAAFAEALESVSKTQFNYDNKTPFEKKMEFIIPFFTFAKRNLTFWLDAIDTNPAFLNGIRDVLSPTWDLQQYDPDEIEDNKALQNAIMNGNIKSPFDANTILKTNFSFMDTINQIVNPLKEFKDSTFFPIKAVINASLQGLSDEAYRSGNAVLSNWVQNYFGALPTEQQLRDKYSEWLETYKTLDSYRASSENFLSNLAKEFKTFQVIPLVGTVIQRLVNTGMYYADDALAALGYATGFTAQIHRQGEEYDINSREKIYYRLADALDNDIDGARKVWLNICNKYGIDPNKNLYAIPYPKLKQMYQEFSKKYYYSQKQIKDLIHDNEDMRYLYIRLRYALGYKGVSLKDLPLEVRNNIYEYIVNGSIVDSVMPVIQDNKTLINLWRSAMESHGIANTPWELIPTPELNAIYKDIATSVVDIAEIQTLLKDNVDARYSYTVAKNKLGYQDIPLNQLPNEVLAVIKYATENQLYKPRPVQRPTYSTRPRYSGRRGRGASRSSARRRAASSFSTLTPGQLNFQYNKVQWPNYVHNQAHKTRHRIYERQYINNVRTPGVTNKIKNSVNNKISPMDLKYRTKDMYYYFKF